MLGSMDRPRLSIYAKYKICQLFFALAFVVIIICLRHMSPFSSTHANEFWFTVLAITLFIGLLFGIAFYYYRAKIRESNMRTLEIETLASTAIKPEEPKEPVAHQK